MSWSVALIALLSVSNPLSGQYNDVPPPAAYALEGVTIVNPSGPDIPGVTIVVRGHLIEAIGPGVPIPPDAEVLSGDSLWIYPGLIDAEGAVEFSFPESTIDRSEVVSWDPPREIQGFMPERRVADFLTADGSDLGGLRKEGVVAAGVHPDDALMPGQGALVLFRPHARMAPHLVVRPDVGLTMAFRTARGGYPGTLFGVMAFIRQQFEDASRQAVIDAARATDPHGLPSPTWDPAYEVLQGVSAGRVPVFFRADAAEDIRRAVSLGAELGFTPVIVGGTEAWAVAGLLASQDVAVLVSVDFDEPNRWKPEAAEEAAEEGETATDESGEGQEADAGAAQEEAPLEPAAWREKKEIEEAYANSGKLAAAGVRFALTSGGGGAKLREGARKAIEYGLGEEAALQAVTTTPAALLGAPDLVRIEAGLPATFIVTNGSLFDQDTRILFTMVEGGLEYGAKPGDEGPAAVDVTGTWTVEISAQGMAIGGTMNLSQDGSTVTGTINLDMGGGDIRNGQVSGTTLSFEIVVGGDTGAELSGTVTGSSISGTGGAEGITFTWTAKRDDTTGGAR